MNAIASPTITVVVTPRTGAVETIPCPDFASASAIYRRIADTRGSADALRKLEVRNGDNPRPLLGIGYPPRCRRCKGDSAVEHTHQAEGY